MKNVELLEKLKDIAVLVKEYSTKEKGYKKLDDLILKIKDDVLKENYEGKTPKQRINYALSWHKKMLKKQCRPVLAYCCKDQIKDYQVITDAQFMVFLNKDEELPIPHYTEYDNGKANYPNTLQLFKSIEYGEEIKLDIKKVNSLLKANNQIFTDYKGYKLIFDKEHFNDLLVFLNIKDNNNVKVLINKQTLIIIKDNNCKGLLCVGRSGAKESDTDFNELLIQE